jgi:phosphoribosylanthranilate isomerase
MAEGEAPNPSTPAVKICGLTRPSDAALAGSLGARWVGVILVPNTPRVRTPLQARALGEAAGVPLALVVADLAPEALAVVAETAGARALQLHGSETPEEVEGLRALGPWELWKALRVRSPQEIALAIERWRGVADLLLLDAWHPGQLGGTGTSFPWDWLEPQRESWPSELRLGVAGGLRPESVQEAALRLRPHLLDVSSGVEVAPGVKDPARMHAFFEALKSELPFVPPSGDR